MMRRLGKFEWDGDQEFAPQYPPQLWNESLGGVGGSMMAASGAFTGYRVRDDELLTLPVRFTADELASFRAMIRFAQLGGTITWTPDLLAPGTTIDVNIIQPTAEDRWEPVYDPTYQRVRVGTIVLRKVDGTAFDLDYFAAA